MFLKAVSGTVFVMINAFYRDKPLVFIGAMFREKLVSHHRAVNELSLALFLYKTFYFFFQNSCYVQKQILKTWVFLWAPERS